MTLKWAEVAKWGLLALLLVICLLGIGQPPMPLDHTLSYLAR